MFSDKQLNCVSLDCGVTVGIIQDLQLLDDPENFLPKQSHWVLSPSYLSVYLMVDGLFRTFQLPRMSLVKGFQSNQIVQVMLLLWLLLPPLPHLGCSTR